MNIRHRAIAVGAALCLTTAVATAACSTRPTAVVAVPAQAAPVSYGLAAYGENGHCYYIDDPAEVTAMVAAGLCPASWTPMLMPLLWHETYYDYYASPAYYNTYVPVRYRTVWVSQSNTFYSTNKTTILVVHTKGTYKDSTGKTVAASAIPTAKMTFGSNVTSKPTFGSVNPVKPQPSVDGAPVAKTTFGSTGKVSPPAKVVPR